MTQSRIHLFWRDRWFCPHVDRGGRCPSFCVDWLQLTKLEHGGADLSSNIFGAADFVSKPDPSTDP